MSCVLSRIVRVHEDIIQVHNDVNVQQIGEDGVQEALESGQHVGEAFWDDPELIRAIASAKSSFRFVTGSDPEKMISMSEIEFGIYACPSRSIEEIHNRVFAMQPLEPPNG
jgi:hypothetical protein